MRAWVRGCVGVCASFHACMRAHGWVSGWEEDSEIQKATASKQKYEKCGGKQGNGRGRETGRSGSTQQKNDSPSAYLSIASCPPAPQCQRARGCTCLYVSVHVVLQLAGVHGCRTGTDTDTDTDTAPWTRAEAGASSRRRRTCPRRSTRSKQRAHSHTHSHIPRAHLGQASASSQS